MTATQSLARAVADTLQDEFRDHPLVDVWYYDGDDVGRVFRSEWATAAVDTGQVEATITDLLQAALDDDEAARLQTNHPATVRISAALLAIAVPVTGTSGVVVVLDTDGVYRVREVVTVIERVIDAESDLPEQRSRS